MAIGTNINPRFGNALARAVFAATFCLVGIAGPLLGGSDAWAAELVSVNGAGTNSGNTISIDHAIEQREGRS